MVGVDLAAQHVAKKKGFRDTICLARLSGWGDSLFFFMDFVLFARVAWSTGYR